MDNTLVPLWIKKENNIKTVCNNLKIYFSEIIPLRMAGFKGTALINTGSEKYIVKCYDKLLLEECYFQMKFFNWFNNKNGSILPSFMNGDDLYIDNSFYFVYHYIESYKDTNFNKCVKSIATFHKLSRYFIDDYYIKYSLVSAKKWLDNLIESSIYFINNYESIKDDIHLDIDLIMYVSILKNNINHYIEIYDDNFFNKYTSVCHGDMNLKNFLFCKDGSCRIIDLDTLSYNITIRDLFGFIKSMCVNFKNEVTQCLIEYDKIYKIDEIEYILLRIMCNPALNLHYIRRNNIESNDNYVHNLIDGMSHVHDILDNDRR